MTEFALEATDVIARGNENGAGGRINIPESPPAASQWKRPQSQKIAFPCSESRMSMSVCVWVCVCGPSLVILCVCGYVCVLPPR